MDVIVIILAAVALLLAAVDVIRSSGQSLTAWAVLALGAAFLITRVA